MVMSKLAQASPDTGQGPAGTTVEVAGSAPEAGSFLYRFRSCKTLFEFKELERLQIYLASAGELNDPMEGYKDVVWRGDAVLWENLLRHYVLSLLLTHTHFLLTSSFEEPHVNAFVTADDLPTDAFRALHAEACEAFLAQTGPESLCNRLVNLNKPLRREGLRLALSCIHARAFGAVVSTLEKRGLMPVSGRFDIPKGADLDALFIPYSSDTDESAKVDFFRSLGTLPMGKLASTWHAARRGTQSTMLDSPTLDKAAWRKTYWESFQGIATTKLQDWKHEEEYRLFVPDMLGLLAQEKENAKVEYGFSSLAGIVFGLRTSDADKLEIIRLIEARCQQEKRQDFAFYQMTYSAQRGQLLRL
jgi:hypothetical protein